MTPLTQVRLSSETFRRWQLRAGLSLPVPLTTTYAATAPLDHDDVVELSRPRIAGSASPGALEGLDSHVERVLDAAAAVLHDARAIVFAIRSEAGSVLTVAGAVRGSEGVVLVDQPGEVAVRPVPASGVADAVARALPSLRAARIPDLQVPQSALVALAEAGSGSAARARVARLAGVPEDVLDELHRIETSRRALGIVGAVRPGAEPTPSVAGATDWYESGRGSVLATVVRPGVVRLRPADRSVLARQVAGALTAV